MPKWILLYKDIAKRFYRFSKAKQGINSLVSTSVGSVHSSNASVGSKPYPGHHGLVTICLLGDNSYSGSWPIYTTAGVNIKSLFGILRLKGRNVIYFIKGYKALYSFNQKHITVIQGYVLLFQPPEVN